uniref:Indole-3-acetaldehyde oxidase n=1 Tax=Lygus hesperus TaxID=30085 RepID=A0A0A9YHM8_LYGHE
MVELNINGKKYTVPTSLPADTSLNAFIREHAHLNGTKFMCLEGGCGACIVSVQSKHPSSGQIVSYSVNSCLVPIFACHGWSVTTVEGLGGKAHGYHKIQQRLAAANGTQCGYCSPGMVMNMHSLLESNPTLTMKDVENSFGGNICRCTGYRPILDAFKSFASDAPPELTQKLADIEDMMCPKSGKICNGSSCGEKCGPATEEIDGGWTVCHNKDDALPNSNNVLVGLQDGSIWRKPSSTKEVFELFDQIGDKSYRMVAGNTGPGVYRLDRDYDVWIDLNGIAELHSSSVTDNGVTLGANISLTEAMTLFYKLAKEKPQHYSYLKTLADHIDLIANVPVRNVGTFAGNLSMKHQHEEFPSDIFLFLEMAGATVVIADKSGMQKEMGLLEYLSTDMDRKLMVKINLPPYDNSSYISRSFKIMPRAQNAHAYVNAGFLIKVDKKDGYKVLEKPRIIFGGIQPKFVHASKSEDFLEGRKLVDEGTLKGVLDVLEKEIVPDHILPDASPEYRRGLAMSLLYKFFLSVDPSRVNDKYKSGGPLLERPVSSAKQDFDTDRNLWPLNKPIPKLEALIQCSGEAEYSNDIPSFPGQLWAQIAVTDRLATVSKIDFSEAKKVSGFWGFYTAKDIPGTNSFIKSDRPEGIERVFVEEGKTADYAGQAVCVVLADSHANAIKAAEKVKISYVNERPPINDVRKIIAEGPKERIKPTHGITPTTSKSNVKYKIKGSWDVPAQYHYTMETHTCVAVPTEDHLEVYPSSQGPTSTQESIMFALAIPANQINMRVRRVGGGYGAKLTRNNHSAVVASLCAYLSRKPVRFVLQLENNMKWAGKRYPVFADYDVGVSETGEIQYLNASVYQDDGSSTNDSAIGGTMAHLPNIYDQSTWNVKGYEVITESAGNSYCRAPGSTEGVALIETIMDHITAVTGKDPIQVRLANMDKASNLDVPTMINDAVESSNYRQRVEEIEKFNKENRWKKRGISLVPMNYPFSFFGGFHGVVSIYSSDGSVAITHGAIEMGQGVNTKVAQVAAYVLGIDVNVISVKPTYNHTSPNDMSTGGSVGSESVAYAVKMCCDQLNERLAPFKKSLGPNAKWLDVIRTAYNSNTDLMATYQFTPNDDVKNYFIYGVTITEVEVDILTGQYHTRRVDLVEDAGQSMSPEVDIGQVEGAFIMATGYWTCEQLVYDPKTGANLTYRTWTYKPPGAKDIPIDFRVTLKKNSTNPTGVLRSKATGEPPFCMAITIPLAIRKALVAARKDSGLPDNWVEMNPPFTAEAIWLNGHTKKDQMVL